MREIIIACVDIQTNDRQIICKRSKSPQNGRRQKQKRVLHNAQIIYKITKSNELSKLNLPKNIIF